MDWLEKVCNVSCEQFIFWILEIFTLSIIWILQAKLFVQFTWYSKGIHGVTRESGERIITLPHMLSDMDKPYGLVALPNECALGMKICKSLSIIMFGMSKIR